MSLEHAQVLARYAQSSPARRAALASDDARMARLGAAVDAGPIEAEHQAAADREYLTVSRRGDGVAFQGFLSHEHAETVFTALRAVAGVPAADDTRTRDQRQAAALVDTSRLVLDRGLAGTGQTVRPHLSGTASWESLQRQISEAARLDRERTTRGEGTDEVVPNVCSQAPSAVRSSPATSTASTPGAPHHPSSARSTTSSGGNARTAPPPSTTGS